MKEQCAACGCLLSNAVEVFAVHAVGNRAWGDRAGKYEAAAMVHGNFDFAVEVTERAARAVAIGKVLALLQRERKDEINRIAMVERSMR